MKRVWGKGGYRKDTGHDAPPMATPTVVQERVEVTPPERLEIEEDTSSTTTAVSNQPCLSS